MKRHPRRINSPRSAQGAIAITAALWLLLIVTALGAVDVGHVWWQRRYLQGVSDMMALAGAQRLDDTCGGPQTVVAQSAKANGYSGTYTVTCGRFDVASSTLATTGVDSTTINAVNVALSSNLKYWFLPMVGPMSQWVNVNSTSRVVNVNAFTLSSTLASVQTGNSPLLNQLLTSLLGTSVNVTVASYQALALAQIKLSDLAVQVNSNGANDLVQMLAQNPSLGTLLTALSKATGSGSAAASILSSLASMGGAAANATVPMDGSNGKAGLLDVGLVNKNGASNATIDALDALMVAAMVANSNGKGVGTMQIKISALSAVPGLTGDVYVALGQPPVLAVGEAGTASTIARSSQIKLLLNLGVSTAPPSSSFSSNFPPLLQITVPIYIAVGNGTATLKRTQCGAGVNDSSADIDVQPSVLQACITSPDNAKNIFNTPSTGTAPSCSGNVNLASINVAGLGLVSVDSKSVAASAQPASSTVTFTGVGHQIVSQNPVSPNSNDLGQDLASLLGNNGNSVLNQLAANMKITSPAIPFLGSLLQLLLSNLPSIVGNIISTLVAPVLSTVVPPLLNLLGAQVGSATVTDISLTCGNVQLVQ